VITPVDHCRERHDYTLMFPDVSRINIQFLNKEPGDTQVDQNGNIIQDMLIVVNRLCVDHVDLTNKIDKITVYKDTSGQVHKTFNYLAFNGDYQIKIHKNLLYTEWLSSYL
jgi:hypothetical protein